MSNLNKKRSIFLVAAIIFLAAGFVSSCQDEDDKGNTIPVTDVTLSGCPDNDMMVTGSGPGMSSVTLTHAIVPSNATNVQEVIWTTTDPSIATVEDGVVTALGPGGVSISVIVIVRGGVTFAQDCKINVLGIPVTSVTLNETAMELEIDREFTLKATVMPEDATNKNIIWTSSNEAIATVDSEGIVTGVSVGQVTITASTWDGGVEATATFNIINVKVTEIILDKNDLGSMHLQTESTLEATILPEDAFNKDFKWSSSNEAVAKVDEDGVVTAVGVGNATITATTDDGGFTASATVEVIYIPVASVSIVQENLELGTVFPMFELHLNTLTATVSPADATFRTISWESDRTDIIEIDQNGRIFAKGAVGTATITVKSDDTQVDDQITVKVDKYYPWIASTNWTFPGYNHGSNDRTIGYSSQHTGDGGDPGTNTTINGFTDVRGRVIAMLDPADNTHWHSRWSGPAEQQAYPHWFIIDLGETVEIEAMLLRRRQGSATINVTWFRFYTSTHESPDQDDPDGGYDWQVQLDQAFDRANMDPQHYILPAPVQARYVRVFFPDMPDSGQGANAMFRAFGLYGRVVED